MAHPLTHGILRKCEKRIFEEMLATIEAGRTICCVTVDTDAGWVDICTNDRDEKQCIVRHDYDEWKRSPRLEDEIEGLIPDWADVVELAEEDEPHGILDEAFGTWESGFYS